MQGVFLGSVNLDSTGKRGVRMERKEGSQDKRELLSLSCLHAGFLVLDLVGLFFPFFLNTNFIFLGSKITADGNCSHEIKRCFLLGRKTMTNPDSVLKSRDITLLVKVHIVKTMAFPVVMYGCEIWTVKKPEHQRTDAFELWCWRRLFRVPWTVRTSNRSILKEINP